MSATMYRGTQVDPLITRFATELLESPPGSVVADTKTAISYDPAVGATIATLAGGVLRVAIAASDIGLREATVGQLVLAFETAVAAAGELRFLPGGGE